MPQLGESVVEGTVTHWLKTVGDPVEEFEALCEVNTDKVDTEIPSPAAGTLLQIMISEGETVNAGTILAWIGKPGDEVPDGDPSLQDDSIVDSFDKEIPTKDKQSGTINPIPSPPGRSENLGFISPIVAKISSENNIDLSQVQGTGRGGRITKKDVINYIDQLQAGQTAVDEINIWETPADRDLFRPTELVFRDSGGAPTSLQSKPMEDIGGILPLSPVRKTIASHMVTSKHTSPHVTTVMEADLSRIIDHRQYNKSTFERKGVRLTFTPYFVAAAVSALKAYPIVNSSWREEGILLHKEINIGMATSLGDEGLIVPIIRNADSLSLLGIAKAVDDLAKRARAKQLKPEEVHGGTFTITNHGISGSLFASPIINQPQCAILGVGVIQKRVVVIKDQIGSDAIAIRPMVYLTLTFDHRILDGAIADYYLSKVVESLVNWNYPD
jgi:2-oxoglutarate dehydrogenase E2 component (dihydrolipoamide succinyltransferase)